MITSKPVLALFLVAVGCCYGDTLTAEKLQDEARRASDCYAGCLVQPALENYPHDVAICRISGAAAGSRPSSLVDNQLPWAILIVDSAVGCNVSPRGERLDYPEGKTCESNGRSVWGLKLIEGDGVDFETNCAGCLTHGQIKVRVDIALMKKEPSRLKAYGVSLPSVGRYRDGRFTRHWPLRANLSQVGDDVGSSDEVPLVVNKESSSIGQLAGEFPFLIEPAAQNGNHGTLYAFHGQDESVRPTPRETMKARKKDKQETNNVNTPPSQASGTMIVRNDGMYAGCLVSHESSSSISISCPQIDSVGAHKEAPQSTIHDQSTPPPSRE